MLTRVQLAVRRQTYLLLLFTLPFICLQTFAQTRLEDYALLLEDPPLARHMAARARVESAQQNLRRELAVRQIPVSGSVETLLNAVFVRVPRGRVAELRSLPGVRRVVWLPRVKRNLNTALNLVNVPQAWTVVGGEGNAGAGVKIAIIDSGIDDTHPAFQDASLSPPAGFPKGDAQYTNGKIIVARSYQPMFPLPDDPTPRDRSGHGTALAMIAAGETNKGPLATITGVAPKAWLGNYKIFGTPGVNDYTSYSAVIQALEDAVADHMDIALLAFGSLPLNGPTDTDKACQQTGVPTSYQNDCDIPAAAVENAVAMGMTVVTAAGNDANSSLIPPALNSIDSPGTAPSAITVGASTNAHGLYASVEIKGSNVPSDLSTIDALVGDGVKLSGPLTATVRDVATVDFTHLACAALPANSFAGSIVLIERGTCDFSTKINYAEQAGAVGVILYQDTANVPPSSSLGAENTGIPAMMIGNADAMDLESYLGSNSNVQATMDPALHFESAFSNIVADFSSRGPSIDYAIKPELVAVGQGIYTATESFDPTGDLYDPTGYTTVDGTSFAAAMVAGAAALVKQKNPGFSAAQIKSALVHTASISTNAISDFSSGEPLITPVGAGKLNAAAALAPGATVDVSNSLWPNAHPGTLSFGWVGPNSGASSASLTITNVSSATATYSISVSPTDFDLDTSDVISVSPTNLQLAAGQQGSVNVSLSGDFSAAGISDGVISITGPSTNLRVPYWYLESDGTPFDIMPIYDGSFVGTAGDVCWYLAFKVLDQWGIAVPDQGVSFDFGSGGAAQSTSTSCQGVAEPSTSTNGYGEGWTNVDLGSTPGEQTFTATAGGLTTSFYATVRPAPSISSNGVLDAGSYQVGQGFAPGSYISIFGSGLSDAAHFLSTYFLPYSMSGVSVSFYATDGSADWPGRLSYAGPNQINVQIPWEMAGQTTVTLAVNVADRSITYPIRIAPYLPAIFQYGNQLAVAQDEHYQLITASNPALRGGSHFIMLYANGLGAVDNTPASGELTPSQPLANTVVHPTVTIGGVAGQVLFSGLTPGSIGLYQLDVVIPQDAPTGLQPVVITENGVSSTTTYLRVQ